MDGRWAKKNEETHYGYKDHAKVDKDSKMIVAHAVTDASVHDSKGIVALIDGGGKGLWADSAYVGEDLHGDIKKRSGGIRLQGLGHYNGVSRGSPKYLLYITCTPRYAYPHPGQCLRRQDLLR
jgi:hypothetical protein